MDETLRAGVRLLPEGEAADADVAQVLTVNAPPVVTLALELDDMPEGAMAPTMLDLLGITGRAVVKGTTPPIQWNRDPGDAPELPPDARLLMFDGDSDALVPAADRAREAVQAAMQAHDDGAADDWLVEWASDDVDDERPAADGGQINWMNRLRSGLANLWARIDD